jgi:hypothetical protein
MRSYGRARAESQSRNVLDARAELSPLDPLNEIDDRLLIWHGDTYFCSLRAHRTIDIVDLGTPALITSWAVDGRKSSVRRDMELSITRSTRLSAIASPNPAASRSSAGMPRTG